MAFVPRRNSCPVNRLSIYPNLRINRTRASIDGSDTEFASNMKCCSRHSSIDTSTNRSPGSMLFYDTVANWESDIIPFPDFDEVESTYLMEQMKEITLTKQTSTHLNLWYVIRTKVSGNFKLKTYSLNPFRGNCFGRNNKKNAGNLDNLHMRGGYLQLSASMQDRIEIEPHHRTQQVSQQANIGARRSQGASSLTQVQVKLTTTLKRSGAIRGRKPKGRLRTTNQTQDSRVMHSYLNSEEFRMSRSNGESSGSAGTMDQAIPPKMKKSNFRDKGSHLPPRAPKQVRFASNVEVVLEHKACEACEHRTQSKPYPARYNDEEASALASTSSPELEDLSWAQAPSGIRFLGTEKTRRLMESEIYALRTMGPILKRDVVCFAWGEFAEPERLRWLDKFVTGEVRAGLDVDCSWLSGAQVERDM